MQVHVLEQKLADVHAMDATSLDRAHRTMCQHVEALEADSKVCWCHVNSTLGIN